MRVTHAANGEVITRINDFLLALDIEEERMSVTKEAVSIVHERVGGCRPFAFFLRLEAQLARRGRAVHLHP